MNHAWCLIIIFSVGITQFPAVAQAQQASKVGSSFIGLAGQYEQVREETLHPLRNQGLGVSLLADFRIQHKHSDSALALELPLGFTTDRYGFTALSFKYGLSYAQTWHTDPDASVGYFAQLNVRERYFFEWDDSHFFWLTDWSLGPRGVVRPPRFQQYELHAQVAILSLVSRSPQQRRNKIDDITTVGGFFSTPQQDLSLTHFPEVLLGELGIRTRGSSSRNYWQYKLQFARTHEVLSYVEIRQSLGFHYAL